MMKISRSKVQTGIALFLSNSKNRIRRLPSQANAKQVTCKKVHRTPKDWLELTKHERELHEAIDESMAIEKMAAGMVAVLTPPEREFFRLET